MTPGSGSSCRSHHYVRARATTAASLQRSRVEPVPLPAACLKHCCHLVQGAIAAAVVASTPPASLADQLTLRFQAAQNPDVRNAQAELVQTFAYVTYYYVNEDFDGVDWSGSAEQALRQSQQASSAAAVRALTNSLLSQLNDPYTRKLDQQAAAVFRAEQDGQVLSYGVGLDCEAATNAHACTVAFVAPNSPAERAGILTGDKVQAFSGKHVDGESSRELKDLLESRAAPDLSLTLQPSTTSHTDSGTSESRRVTLTATAVDIDPVQYGFVRRDDGILFGYLRIGAMASTTPQSVQKALRAFEIKQTSGIIIDLRDNPGGVVEAGRGVGNHLLSPGATFVTGGGREATFFDVKVDSDASQDTLLQPKMVLINNNTASSSEMLASALRARGALLVGEHTHGKSRAQKAIDLDSGALLLVSMVKYYGASGEAFDDGGLKPDLGCAPERMGEERYEGGALTDDIDLRQDPCIDLAANRLQARVR